MHAQGFIVGICRQVAVQAVGIEGGDGGHQTGHSGQTAVERLVSAEFVVVHIAGPEAFAAEAHIPVGEVVDDEGGDEAAGTCGLVVLEGFGHAGDERLEFGEYPAVHFGTGLYLRFVAREVVLVGVGDEEVVGLEQFAKEGARHFLDALLVKLEVIPRLRVGNHVPAQGVGAVVGQGAEGVNGIAETLGHLGAVLIQHKAIGDDGLESLPVEDHRGDGVQGEEPTAGLVHTFGDEVGGEG